MHEMSICESLLDILREQARASDFERVTTVRLELGALSCVEPEALRFCFDVVTRGTLAQDATLDIEVQPASGWCWDCAEVVQLHDSARSCPVCGGHKLQVAGGDQMKVKDLEVT